MGGTRGVLLPNPRLYIIHAVRLYIYSGSNLYLPYQPESTSEKFIIIIVVPILKFYGSIKLNPSGNEGGRPGVV